MAVLLIATLDTKGREAGFVRDELVRARVEVELVDAGALGKPQVVADVSRERLFKLAGTSIDEVRARGERGFAVDSAAAGARALALTRLAEG